MAGNANIAGRSVVSKVAAILRCFDSGRPCTVSELSRMADLPLSTTFRLVTDLVSSGIMTRTERGRYDLRTRSSDRAEEPGSTFASMRERARPVLHDLAAVTRRPIRLGVLQQLAVAYIEHSSGSVTEFGALPPLPLHATSAGKILLAFSPPDLFEAAAATGLPAYTAQTITDAGRLRAELFQVRRTAVAVDWGELDSRSSSMAVAVFGPHGHVVAALGLPVTGQAEMIQLQQAALIAGRTLSRQLAASSMTPAGLPPDETPAARESCRAASCWPQQSIAGRGTA